MPHCFYLSLEIMPFFVLPLCFLARWVAREPALLPIHGILFCVDVNECEVVVPELFSDRLMFADRVQSVCRGVIVFKSF